MDRSSSSSTNQPAKPRPAEGRRGFFGKCWAIFCGGAALGVPVGAGVAAVLSPLREKAQGGQLMRIALLENLPDDGTPGKFPVIADRWDAWNHFASEPVGAVFLRKTASHQVQAFQVVCPHAGCFVGYEAGKKGFYCPCHHASFDLAGKRTDARSPSPRDLDTLECQVRNGNEV
jgi:Rieske Fe-S protein